MARALEDTALRHSDSGQHTVRDGIDPNRVADDAWRGPAVVVQHSSLRLPMVIPKRELGEDLHQTHSLAKLDLHLGRAPMRLMHLRTTEELPTERERSRNNRREGHEDAPQLHWPQAAKKFGDSKVRRRLGGGRPLRRLDDLLLPAR